MRLMYSCPSTCRFCKTFSGTGLWSKYLTPERYAGIIAYTNKRKHNCSVLPMLILQIYKLGPYRNAFLANSFHLSKATAKIRIFFDIECFLGIDAFFLGAAVIVFACYVVFFVYLYIAFYGHGRKP